MQGLGRGHISQWGWNTQKALLETVLERFPSCVPVSSFPQAASLSGSPFAVTQTTESSLALFLSLSHQVSHRSLAEACPTAGEDSGSVTSIARDDLTKSSWRTRDSLIVVLKKC